MEITYATKEDIKELTDFLYKVFTDGNPTHPSFLDIYPDLFLPNDKVMGRHALLRDEKGIAACVGTYPMLMQVGGKRILTAGVGQVATRIDCRGCGYMKTLITSELNRCKNEGCAIAWLGGRYDRYKHFGFEPAGLNLNYYFDSHSLSKIKITRTISAINATAPEAISKAHFALREQTVASIIEPIETYRLQMHRLGFTFEIWSSFPKNSTIPDAWAVLDKNNNRIEEWCGSVDGRLEILRSIANATQATVLRTESPFEEAVSCELRKNSCEISVVTGYLKAILNHELLPTTEKPHLGPFERPNIPFYIPTIFHV